MLRVKRGTLTPIGGLGSHQNVELHVILRRGLYIRQPHWFFYLFLFLDYLFEYAYVLYF